MGQSGNVQHGNMVSLCVLETNQFAAKNRVPKRPEIVFDASKPRCRCNAPHATSTAKSDCNTKKRDMTAFHGRQTQCRQRHSIAQGVTCARTAALPMNRCNSTPRVVARTVDTNTGDAVTNDNYVDSSSLQLPKHSPCNPDLSACCENVAAFLATAAAAFGSSSDSKQAIPTPGFIYGYMRILFVLLQLEPECCVYVDIYIKRLLSSSEGKVKIRPENWKKILVGACLIASKFVDDITMNNTDFAAALTGCSVTRMNQVEAKFLHTVGWQVHVSISEYTARYFELVQPKDRGGDWDIDFEMITPHFAVSTHDFIKSLMTL